MKLEKKLHGKMGLGPYGAFLNIMFAVQKIGRKILNPLNAKLRVSRTFVRKYMLSNGSKSTLQTFLKKKVLHCESGIYSHRKTQTDVAARYACTAALSRQSVLRFTVQGATA